MINSNLLILVTGIVAASVCTLEIIALLVRHLIYRLTDGAKRLKYLAKGVAIKGWECIKGICKAIVSNGLATVFSLLGGALGMLVPIPVLNLILSMVLGAAGGILGQYIAGIPMNFYRRHRCLQERAKKQNAQKM